MRKIMLMGSLVLASLGAYAESTNTPIDTDQVNTQMQQPFTKAEIQQGMQEMQQRLNSRIEAWGAELKRDDFEWTWRGRQLKQPKRQEVCGIFQGIVNETWAMALKNKARLSAENQQVLQSRSAFIEALGYENNIVDTKMGFDCRLK